VRRRRRPHIYALTAQVGDAIMQWHAGRLLHMIRQGFHNGTRYDIVHTIKISRIRCFEKDAAFPKHFPCWTESRTCDRPAKEEAP
jgi:hypothetical protein